MVLSLAPLAALAGPCTLAAAPEAVVAARAVDGDTVTLADGRTVRIAGILAPKPPLDRTPERWPLGAAARNALEALVGGRALSLRPAARAPDRHGRAIGHLAAADSADHAGVATALLARGLARVAADRAGRDCGATLRAAEETARDERLGLWSDPYYEVRDAGRGAAFADDAGRFVVAEGTVASVRTVSGRTYVNFGARWRDALSLTLSEAVLKRLGGTAAVDIARGARLRVRGVVERRTGPTIAVMEAGQIERIAESGRRR